MTSMFFFNEFALHKKNALYLQEIQNDTALDLSFHP